MKSSTRNALLAGGLALTLGAAFVLYTGVRCYQSQYAQFERHPQTIERPAGTDVALQDRTFVTRDGRHIKGWSLPSRNRAAVVLCHGAFGSRIDTLAEAQALHARGFGVLFYDSPGHGESEGDVDWSGTEYGALRSALDEVSKQAEVDPARIGVFGFSMGTIVATMVAADDDRVRALALAAAIPDVEQQVRWEYRRWGPLSQLPALWAAARGGIELDGPMPIDVIAKLSPRPLLMVVGSDDQIVPPAMTRELFSAAGEPKKWLTVPGAAHGGYARLAPTVYLEKLVTFFDEALTR